MRIRRVVIDNFRCLEHVEIDFDDVTTFLGPNGAGKSTILRALDWFFNSSKRSALTVDDVFLRDADRAVRVSVEFDRLTESDRSQLGKYAEGNVETVLIAKHWENGLEKIVGRGRIFPPFEVVRAGGTAGERRAAYQELRAERPELGLPGWTNDAAVAEFMSEWEASHPELLETAEVESATHFFGFAGHARMSGLFDFIFVSADMRASEEAVDSRSAVIGRILEQAVDRSNADVELSQVLQAASDAQREIHQRHFGTQLEQLSAALTAEVCAFATGREVRISSSPTVLQAPQLQFDVSVADEALETTVDRQGHGFQRALLIGALKLLAERGRGEGGEGVICLAIEEPELYQHPLQARSFAAVLRSLAEDADNGVQVAYATHSPYFIEARSFHQIRRVTREGNGANVRVVGSTVEKVVARLEGFVEEAKIRRQLDSVCMGGLGEGFFADVVLLVEGTTDRAVLTGAAARDSVKALLDGVFVCEAGGKASLLLPHAILSELGIPSYLVADNDSHLLQELDRAKGSGDLKRVKALKASVADSITWNRRLLRFFECEEVDWPVGAVGSCMTFFDGGLELALETMWPSWAETRDALIEMGVGFSGKDRATYEEAAIRASGEVPEVLALVLEGARALRDVA